MKCLAALALAALLAAPAALAADYAIDIAEIRRLADAEDGDNPREIRVETVGNLSFTWNEVVDGAQAEPVDMALLAYQLVFPDRTALIDTTMDKEMADAWQVKDWDIPASARLDAAIAKADFILITHEHADHIGRIVTGAADSALLRKTKLTGEQIANPKGMEPLKWPEGATDALTPLTYDVAQAIAPGVVVLKAPGHTPGTQMVYVKTAGGQEYLFLGDVAWQWRNIVEGKSRSAAAVKMLGEDDAAVKAQIDAIAGLTGMYPTINIVPGHDGALVQKLVSEGKLIAAFK